jgi:hypothetical protein
MSPIDDRGGRSKWHASWAMPEPMAASSCIRSEGARARKYFGSLGRFSPPATARSSRHALTPSSLPIATTTVLMPLLCSLRASLWAAEQGEPGLPSGLQVGSPPVMSRT